MRSRVRVVYNNIKNDDDEVRFAVNITFALGVYL